MEPLTDEQRATVEANLGLVHEVAMKLRNIRLDLEERVQAGTLGLIRAVQGYDPGLGFRLSTYAHNHIKVAILRAEVRNATIHVPYHMRFPGSDDATKARIARLSGRAARARRVASLSAFATDQTIIHDPDADAGSLADEVRDAMRFLSAREREVVKTTVLDGELLKDVGARLGVTKQAIQQARAKALAKLRKTLSHHDHATRGA